MASTITNEIDICFSDNDIERRPSCPHGEIFRNEWAILKVYAHNTLANVNSVLSKPNTLIKCADGVKLSKVYASICILYSFSLDIETKILSNLDFEYSLHS